MLKVPKEDKIMFKLLCSFLKANGKPTKKIYEFASKYDINIDEMQKQLIENQSEIEYKLRIAGLL